MADALALAQALMRCPSVTPVEAGALDLAQAALERLGFKATRYTFGDVDNLYARRGTASPNFCFAGHVDVVPPGEGWSVDPFAAEVRDGQLIGRGAADMKAAIAAMITATENVLAAGAPHGSISFLLTCDEEGPGQDGTKRVLAALREAGEQIDHCVVGEPTSDARVGDTIKNGRRGSLNIVLTMEGRQGHVAYPDKALNPVTPLIAALAELKARKLDDGASGFTASNLEVTTVDVGNPTHNVIPSKASAKLNMRFNTHHSVDALREWVRETAEKHASAAGAKLDMKVISFAEPFYTTPGPFTDALAAAVREASGVEPTLSTTGGTSDARYLKDYCSVAEFGLRNATAHMVDEQVAVEDVQLLTRCYEAMLRKYFAL
ncbi:MAG: succinyl-diaminopimelate desuccinylase [Hyphomonadaceae bacterium]|nr:succinyl-diaminopimelate desuccinylase [Hyphomonadaceae bacterium]